MIALPLFCSVRPHRMRRFRRASIAAGWSALLMLALVVCASRIVPLPRSLFQPVKPSVDVLDRHGVTLRERPVDARFAREIGFAEIPPTLVNAIIAAEDKRFFQHRGVDWLATARAVWKNVVERRVTSGASTISQQLIKVAAPRPRTVRTKIIEALAAVRLERTWSKQQILAAYVNRIEFGNSNIGIAAAAEYYFDKPLSDLSNAEGALLAGLPKNPRRLNPMLIPHAARQRQLTVLRRMHSNGMLDAQHYERAVDEPVRLRASRRPFRAPHFVDLVLRETRDSQADEIRTTLDLNLNRVVEEILKKHLAAFRAQNLQNAAIVVIDNASGELRALVGSGDYFSANAGQVNGALAPRSAGSTLKPFVYLLAMEKEATPATVFADTPAVFATSSGLYRPENYNRRFLGPVRLRFALGNSLNIPAVKALASIGGPAPLRERLRAWGIRTLEKPPEFYGLGLALGNAEVRLIELTNCYAALARLGEYRPLRILTGPHPGQNGSIAPRGVAPRREHAWLIADILADNRARTYAFGAHSTLRFDFPVACKTGTSSDFRDNWAIGYTPEFTVGVWAGNFDGSSMRELSGVAGAAPILHDVFDHLHRCFGATWFARPDGIIERDVHPITGKLIATARPGSIAEKFGTNELPPAEAAADYDASGRVILPIEYRAWLESASNAMNDRVVPAPAGTKLEVVSPLPGTTFILDPDIPTSARVPLVARGEGRLLWQSPTLECRQNITGFLAIAQEGEHRLYVTDPETGESGETWIKVRSL